MAESKVSLSENFCSSKTPQAFSSFASKALSKSSSGWYSSQSVATAVTGIEIPSKIVGIGRAIACSFKKLRAFFDKISPN